MPPRRRISRNSSPSSEDEMSQIMLAMNELRSAIMGQRNLVQALSLRLDTPPVPKPEDTLLPDVLPFAGDRSQLENFLVQLDQFFKAQPARFNSEDKKIAYVHSR